MALTPSSPPANGAAPRPRRAPFFRSEESSSGGLLSRRYAARVAFSCEDWDSFKEQMQKLQLELAEWLGKRGRKANRLALAIEAHPWIHGRVLEALRRARDENSALGTLLRQGEVTLHLYAEDEPVGQFHALSTADGKPVSDAP